MKAHVTPDGKLIAPVSATAGQLRHQQLVRELEKLNGQILKPTQKFRTKLERERWLERAKGLRGWLQTEERLLSEWLRVRGIEILSPRTTISSEDRVVDLIMFWKG